MLVALHGNLGTKCDWDFLTENRDTLAVDLWKYAHLSFQDFATTIRNQAKEGAVLLGYSLGGRLALHCLAEYPNHWGGAIFLSTHPGLQSEAERKKRLLLDQEWSKLAKEAEWEQFLKKWNDQPIISSSALPSQVAASEREAVSFAFDNWSLGRQQDMRRHLGQATFPLLWITGELDAKFNKLAKETAPHNPAFFRKIVSDAGHRVTIDQPETVRRLITKYIKSL